MMTAVQMRERADHYFRRARDEVDDQYRETLIDLAIDFDTIALDLEAWEKGAVSIVPASKNKRRLQSRFIDFFRLGLRPVKLFYKDTPARPGDSLDAPVKLIISAMHRR